MRQTVTICWCSSISMRVRWHCSVRSAKLLSTGINSISSRRPMIGPIFSVSSNGMRGRGIIRPARAGRHAASRLELSAAGGDAGAGIYCQRSPDPGAACGITRPAKFCPPARVAFYFLAIGLAFMFMEIAFIQKFVLFLAHPLYAVGVVLCAFLVFAAAGAWLTGRGQEIAPAAAMWPLR